MQNNYLNKILNGNTFDILKEIPDEIVDLGITSPPYNKGENKKGWLVKNVKYSSSSDKMNEEEYQEDQIKVLNELYRIVKSGGSFFYNHKIRWEKGNLIHPIDWLRKTEWIVRQEIIWDRMIAANIRGWRFWQVDERIYWLYKPIAGNRIGKELNAKHALLTSIWRFPPEKKNPHPAPFPLSLPVRVINSILHEERGVIIDPYSGSGTTLVAARILGHDYIGIDISKDYISIANKRIKNSELEVKIAELEKEKHKVRKTFSDRKMKGDFTGKHRINSKSISVIKKDLQQ
ncbi:MAG: site-specific DNA-methyltransferase [Candidatus Coatesbacteria bacterium]|nr:site-specific DNA-methyltransferase [Candidatus Coatesbacteria bacterium]